MEIKPTAFVGTMETNEPAGLQPLLQKTSRTFALTIPLLLEHLQMDVAVDYLLFRMINAFKDATRWEHVRRANALGTFAQIMESAGAHGEREQTARWVHDPPLDHAGYLELLAATPDVLDWQRALPRPAAREQLRRHVARSARGMIDV